SVILCEFIFILNRIYLGLRNRSQNMMVLNISARFGIMFSCPFQKSTRSLQIEPTELLSRKLTSTLIQNKVEINIGGCYSHRSFITRLSSPLPNHINVISSFGVIPHIKLGFGSNEIHFGKTDYKGIARASHLGN